MTVRPYIGRIKWQGRIIGTGFVVHASGLVATAYHVLRNAVQPFDGQTFTFELLADPKLGTADVNAIPLEATALHSATNDVALLQMRAPVPDNLPVAPLIHSDGAKPGMHFHLQGYGVLPKAPDAHEFLSASGGIVGAASERGVRLLQLDSKQVLQGMSGGPIVVDAVGGVVAVLSHRYSIDPKTGMWMRDAAWAAGSEYLAALYPELLRVRSSRRRDFYIHVPLPDTYVPRLDLLAAVRVALLGSAPTVALTSELIVPSSSPATSSTVLHGMGGIGKSVTARALCDDPEVQAQFPDGILWTTLGKEPELVSKLREWIDMLGGTVSYTGPTMDQLKATLAELLRERACLLVVDDVWRHSDIDIFRDIFHTGGPRCRLLITTRDAATIDGPHTQITSVPLMSQDEAIALLIEQAAGKVDPADPLLPQIVKKLGYLPLAVRLAGPQLRTKTPAAWLQRFNLARLTAARPETVHDNLMVTFDLSVDKLDEQGRQLYAALAIFKEDDTIHEAGIVQLWHALQGLDAEDIAEKIDDLRTRALLDVVERHDHRAVVLHDLMREYMRHKLGEQEPATHRALLDAYRATCTDARWHTAPDDGYLYDHLAYHLDAVGADAELDGLFADHHWLHVRVPQRDYTYDGYIDDLMLNWSRAHKQTEQQIMRDEQPTRFAQCIRYALIRTSINSLAGNYVPELVARAVELETWKAERALSIARTMPDMKARATMYTALASQLHGALLQQVLDAAHQMANARDQADVLIALAPQLHGTLLQQALDAARHLADAWPQARVLTALAHQFEGDARHQLLQQALDAARQLTDARHQVRVLTALALQFQGDTRHQLLQQALDAARQLADAQDQADVFIALAPHLHEDLLQQALDAAHHIRSERYQADVFIALASHLHEDLLQQALDAARQLADEGSQARVLTALAPHLHGDLLQQALDAARQLADEGSQVRVLTALAPQVQGDTRHQLLQQALDTARQLADEGLRVEVLTELAPQLHGALLQQALNAARQLTDAWDQARVLITLAPQLHGTLLQQALDAAR